MSRLCSTARLATMVRQAVAAPPSQRYGNRNMKHYWIAVCVLAFCAPGLPAAEVRSTVEDRSAVSLTVYNTDLALVRDQRSVDLPAGVSNLQFADVSARIRPETAQLYGLVSVLEQNFDFDLLSPRTLLQKYVGRQVGLIRTHPQTGEERRETGTVLSAAEGGVVFRIGDRIETAGDSMPWRFVFDQVPPNLRERPTLTMQVDAPQDGSQSLELAYLTGGLSWRADYVATLNPSGDVFDLLAWVTVHNQSSVEYRDAALQFIAGDVNRVPEPALQDMRGMAMRAEMADAPMAREAVFEYHLYSLGRTTTLADQQSKQLKLFEAAQVPVSRRYRVDATGTYYGANPAQDELKADTMLRFENSAPALGQPLPGGIVRFYQRDAQARIQFVGENRIDHTPDGRDVSLTVGKAFDITATRRQTDYRKVYGDERESAWQVVVHNAKSEVVEVEVVARFSGDWEITEQSDNHEREDAFTALWRVRVPAKGESTLDYRVRIR